ncbi:3-methylfumaryl-CoA hydratase [Aliiruegeria haliotis]|uniref:3-methylfumaryl-CoA hydratase n=1 Tax=Aliiruegeria haliotis TaxID=1280846 RepID=A0A2T0RSK9_9RHOB|nr:MaoC family dehydratase N-terminal domain-containing protein [Aliiruegeria haliotis]PRY24176.1 3-methylfumaryl-CoA hydratase [Aliiruegeria haliotis]
MQEPVDRKQIVTDTMDAARAQALRTCLGLPAPGPGAPLPPFFHQIYFWEPAPAEALGRDGHPAVGHFIPDMGLPRRMWAGGRLEFHAPLHAGSQAVRVSTIAAMARKQGRTGPLGFVTVQHEIRQAGVLCVTEEQDLVYREDPDPAAPPPPPRQAPEDSEPESRGFDSTLLFRYSALTFNGHRIHYDPDYARDLEGYAGLVVHGPLLAQLLMLKAEAIAPLRTFRFRGVRALILGETAVLNRSGPRLWIRNGDGDLITEAEAGR